MQIEAFYHQAEQFLHYLHAQLIRTKVQFKEHWLIDHICYRAESEESYLENKNFLMNLGTLLIESPVNGRLISTFKLNRPIPFLEKDIWLVELPAPKAGKMVKEGFEHIEIVVDESFESIQRKYPCHYFETKGLEKVFNAELEMGFEDCAIKFHHLSLESVVRLESNKKVFSAMMDSKVLVDLKAFHPEVVGDYLLGKGRSQTYLDILLYAPNFDELKRLKNYSWMEVMMDGVKTLETTLEVMGVKLRLRAQMIPTVEQRAFLDFQKEERI